MTLADVYEHNAKECREAAERSDNPIDRARLLKTAREWWQERESATEAKNALRRLSQDKDAAHNQNSPKVACPIAAAPPLCPPH